MSEESYCDINRISVKRIEKSLAKDIIVKNHYSHKWSLCQVAYGVFYKTDQSSEFFNMEEEKLIGCIVFGQPVGRSAAESVSTFISVYEVFELTRLFVFDGYGRNIESYSLSKALGLLKHDFPHIKAVITYADGEYGHKGTIYQACNFYYQGHSSLILMPHFSVSLVGPPYDWIHSRTVFSMYGSHNVDFLKKRIGKTFWRKKESSKHRYVYLMGNKKDKRFILKNLKHPFQPYPKETSHVEEIEQITVESSLENQYFG